MLVAAKSVKKKPALFYYVNEIFTSVSGKTRRVHQSKKIWPSCEQKKKNEIKREEPRGPKIRLCVSSADPMRSLAPSRPT